ncbi:MAG: pilus assembly protein HicB [Bacteroidaceae bacterium]|nr:pilus assembly protein HicB [Bacteroidaceae bacterium]
MAQKVTIVVEKGKGDKNFACFMADELPGFGLAGYGHSAQEAIDDLHVALKETREELTNMGQQMPELEFDFKFDVGSFFDYYPLNVTETAKRIGINASLLRQYVSGVHVPQAKQLQRIHDGLVRMFQWMDADSLISKPTTAYVQI